MTDPDNAQLQDSGARLNSAEEERAYAEKGLYRYRNHRGEIEWLTKAQIEQRKERRKRSRSTRSRASRSSKSRISSRNLDAILGGVISAALVLVILSTTIYFIARNTGSNPRYVIDVVSHPPGAAVFVNGVATGHVTDSSVHIEDPGEYEVTVHLPGYLTIPPSFSVEVHDDVPKQSVTFSLHQQGPAK